MVGGIGRNDGFDRTRGFDRDGAFFDDDFMAVGDFGNQAGGGLDVAEVGSAAGADAVGLGGGAD